MSMTALEAEKRIEMTMDTTPKTEEERTCAYYNKIVVKTNDHKTFANIALAKVYEMACESLSPTEFQVFTIIHNELIRTQKLSLPFLT